MSSDVSTKILSDIIAYTKYARYIKEQQRRETWEEIVDRNKNMHIRKFPELKDEIEEAYKYEYDKKVLSSGRSLQFAGKAIEVNNTRIFNCSYLPINHPDAFSETCFLLLSGAGVGYSVQTHHVYQLPSIFRPTRNRGRKKRYLIGDSIEGWSDAIKMLVESYFYKKQEIDFDFRDIRPKGALLVTSGGKAPGPEPLRVALTKIQSVFESAIGERGENTKLKPIEAHDILCHIADAVLSGGIRRAAMIAGFSPDDIEMIESKMNSWYELHPERGRANNSAIFYRPETTEEQFFEFWSKVQASGSGEPGIFWTNDKEKEIFTNPCSEVSLYPFSFCNLTTVNVSNIDTQEELNACVKAATFIGTLQASYTNFHYLRDIWREVTERDALIGVSMTGIGSGKVLELDLVEAAEVVNKENARVADMIGINHAARTTVIKPEGTSSSLLGVSSGIHAWHNPYYIRRIRVGKNESIYQYLSVFNPDYVEDCIFKSSSQAVISLPIKAPEGSIFRDEDEIDLLERAKRWNVEWIKTGHRSGENLNNVSITVSVKDWNKVGKWMWENRESYHGIAVLPYDGGTYKQAPFEDCDEETYEKMIEGLKDIDLSLIREDEDLTNLQGEIACSGNACEITQV